MITGTADCAAQCHGPRGIMAALNVGVCIIEHGISHGGDGPRGECRSWWYLPPANHEQPATLRRHDRSTRGGLYEHQFRWTHGGANH